MQRSRTLLAATAVLAAVACGGSGDEGAVSRPSSTSAPQVIEIGGFPNGIAFAGGELWVADPEAGSLSSVDPSTGAVGHAIDLGGGPFLVEPVGDEVWVSRHLGGDVTRVDVATGREQGRISVGKFPEEVSSSAGAVWVVGDAARTVYRVDAATGEVRPVVQVKGEIEGVAVAEEAIWLTVYGRGRLFRFTTDGKAQGSRPAGRGASGVAVGGGLVWVANFEDGTLSMFDVRSGRPTGEVDTGGSPRNLAFLHGRLWASDSAEGMVYEVEPDGSGFTSHEVPAPVVGFAETPDAVWATSGDAGALVRLNP